MRIAVRLALRVVVLLVLVFALPSHAVAAGAAPDPDSACASEASFKSTAGTTKASLTIVNNTDETVQSLWLDYHGARVFYKQVAPHSRYVQPTWLTHPWIIASLGGTCYRLVVMNALQQTVTLDPGAGGVVAPVVTFPPPLETFPTAATAAPGGLGTAPGTSTGSDTGVPVLPVVGGLAALLAILGGLFATGHLPGFGGSGSGSGADGSSGSAGSSGIALLSASPGETPITTALRSTAHGAPGVGRQLGNAVAASPGGTDPPLPEPDDRGYKLPPGEELRDALEQMQADNLDVSIGVDEDADYLSVGVIYDIMHFDRSISSRPSDGMTEALGPAQIVGGQIGEAIGGQSAAPAGSTPAPTPTGTPSAPASQFQLQQALGSLQGQFQDLIAATTAGNDALQGAIGSLGASGSNPLEIQQAIGSIQAQMNNLVTTATAGHEAVQGAIDSLSAPGVTQLQVQQVLSSIQDQYAALRDAMAGGNAALQGSIDSLATSAETQVQLQQAMSSIQDQFDALTDTMSSGNAAQSVTDPH